MSFFRRRMMIESGYPVTFNLDGLTTTASNKAISGLLYIVSFTGDTGKLLFPDSVIVTMGGTDITSTAYNLETNRIEIPSATGAIDITAKGITIDSAYKPLAYISAPIKQNANMINTGYAPNSNTIFTVDANVIAATSGYNCLLWGIKNPNTAPSASAPQFCFWHRISSANSYSYSWGSKKRSTTSTTNGRPRVGTRTKFICDKGTFKYTNNSGTEYSYTLNGGTWTNTAAVKVFNYSSSGSANYGCYGYIYRVTASEDNNGVEELKIDYIPAKRLSDGVVGLYDIKNDVFKANENYTEPCIIITNTYTNCSLSRQSTAPAAYNKIALNQTWSYEYTPSTDYTFNDSNAVFEVIVNGIDKTSDYATYDSSNDTWTVTMEAHWLDDINITATAVATS